MGFRYSRKFAYYYKPNGRRGTIPQARHHNGEKSMHHAEIGGYLELEHFGGREYYPDAVALNCARNAFAYLIEARHIHEVWIPWFVCASVEQAAGRYDLDVHRYAVDNRLRPDWSTIELGPEGYLYLIDYYGLLSDDEIREAAARADNRIVVDEVMAFFHKPVDGLDTIYSTRKFFGVPDGAYLSTDAHIDRELPTDESFDRMRFVLGRFERSANEFYQLASDNNKFFITEDIKLMSPLTHNILRAVDYPRVMSIRERNYAYLRTRLDGINGLSVCDHPGPFMYPLLIEDGMRIRKEMQRRKIYVSTLWPHALDAPGNAPKLASDILPLLVDQRYTLEDMDYMCDTLLELMGEKG